MTVLDAVTAQECFVRMGLPFRFSAEERVNLTTTDVVIDSSGVFGFPTPASDEDITLMNMHRILGVNPNKPPSFFDHPWYLNESFMETQCPPGWHFIQVEPRAESIERPYDYYRSLEAKGWTAPLAVEVVLMLFLQYALSGEHLLLKKHTWCVDEATLGRQVTIGAFGRNGVFISGHPSTFASRGLGICGKLMIPPIRAISH